MILRCTCKNEDQDQLHGIGMRVHNKTAGPNPTYRCTVCKNERSPNSDSSDFKPKKK